LASRTNSPPSALSLLRRYLQVYWLKPFDAVNDTANAWVLSRLPWQEPILEVGGGDGVFSFILHGGEFVLTDDRYDQSDPGRPGDIFDVYRKGSSLTIKREAGRAFDVGIDLKWSHVLKARETGLYRSLVVSAPEPLPFAAQSFKTVFLYIPHGLRKKDRVLDYERILKEIRRVILPDGTLLMTAVNRDIHKYFICYPLHRFCERRGWLRLSAYFKKLDAGRYAEISGLGRTGREWTKLLEDAGFSLVESWTQVRPLAWRVYDFQTRPLLKALIHWNWFLKRGGLKTAVKAVCVYASLLPLVLFYQAFARPKPVSPESENVSGVFFSFRAVPGQA